MIHTYCEWKTTRNIDKINQSNVKVSLVTVDSRNLTLPNQQFRITEDLSIYRWKIQEFQIANWYDTYKSLNTADPYDNLGERVIVAEVDWAEGTSDQIVNPSFAAVAGSTFVPQTIQVSATSLHVHVWQFYINFPRICAQIVFYNVTSLREAENKRRNGERGSRKQETTIRIKCWYNGQELNLNWRSNLNINFVKSNVRALSELCFILIVDVPTTCQRIIRIWINFQHLNATSQFKIIHIFHLISSSFSWFIHNIQ